MESVATGGAANLVSEVVKFMFQKITHHASYVFRHKKRVENFEKKLETLKERRDGVQRDVDVAARNVEQIYAEVESWLNKVDKMIDEEAKKVKDLGDKAKNNCFIGLCPNFKSRYQLSKKAEEEAQAADELLQQGHFERVSYRDLPQPIEDATNSKDFEAFDSRRQVFEEIMEALKDPNFNIIGVYVMAGVGKTTLVKEVARQVQRDTLFDSVVTAAVTQNPEIEKIQDQISELLGLKLEEKSVVVRAARLHERLKQEKKILVVLDNVWTRLDLKEVGIPHGNEHKGCTVLLTSRDLNVLVNGMDAHRTFPMGVLKQEEAWQLFKKMAGNSVENPDLVSIATAVAEKCGGLPIAISTVARALRKKQLFEWKNALRHLQRPSSSNFKGVPSDAYSAIELSYDHLESDELKQTLILCSLLGHDARIQDLLIYTMGLGIYHGVSTVEETRDRLLTVVSSLKASSLLLDSYTTQRFDMHDLICDVTRSIASRDNHVLALKHNEVLRDWPDRKAMEKCNMISLLYASTIELPEELRCPELTLFVMASKDPSVKIPTSFFKEMKSLKLIDLTEMHFASLPQSICLLSSLRALCLYGCVLGDIAIISELKNLEILILYASEFEILPEAVGLLVKLKMLDLSRCTRLKVIPRGVLSSLSSLEELLMGNSFVGWEAEGHSGQPSNASLAEFKAFSATLTALEVHIPDAKIIPKDFFFENLQRYQILTGEAWVWEDEIEEFSRTLKLELHTSIGYLNDGMKMLLNEAENVHLDKMVGVQILLHGLEDWNRFQQLKNLHIQNGALLEYILNENGVSEKFEFPQLKSLTLQDLPNFISFCSKNNGSISISPQALPLFNEKVSFPNLEKLTISHLRNVKRIWSDQLHAHSFGKLKELNIEYCDELLNVFPSFEVAGVIFQSLELLKVTDCGSLEQVFDIKETCIATMQLRQLYLHRLPKLKHVWNYNKDDPHGNTTISFQNLRDIEIWECRSLKSVFPFSIAKSSLQQLQSLDVYNSGVEEIVSKNSEGLEQETQFEFKVLLCGLFRISNVFTRGCTPQHGQL